MGNDGGSIPTRRELVKEAARNPNTTELKETQQEQQEWNWKNCPLSHGPLVLPIVSDSSGRLYNKDAVLRFLLPAEDGVSKADSEELLAGRVRGLKDVVEVKFEVETDDTKDQKRTTRTKDERWVCPITRKQLGPSLKSVYLVPCGHAFSESAIREVKAENCLQCNERYEPSNVIPILPISADDIEWIQKRAQRLSDEGLAHSLKKAQGSGKKRKKNGEAVKAVPAAAKPVSDGGAGVSGIKNAATASLTAKVLLDEDERKKRQKLGMNDNLKSLFSADRGDKTAKGGDFMTRGYSIPTNAKR